MVKAAAYSVKPCASNPFVDAFNTAQGLVLSGSDTQKQSISKASILPATEVGIIIFYVRNVPNPVVACIELERRIRPMAATLAYEHERLVWLSNGP